MRLHEKLWAATLIGWGMVLFWAFALAFSFLIKVTDTILLNLGLSTHWDLLLIVPSLIGAAAWAVEIWERRNEK